VTLQDVHLNVGKNKTLVATGIDANGKSYTFSNPVWQINGGGTLTNKGGKWTLTGDQSGKWELTCTDPAKPGITGRATVLVAGVVVDYSGTLQIIGTGGDDHVSISQSGTDSLRVQANFLAGKNRTVQFALDQIYQIEVYGGTGHDMLNASGLSTPVMTDGGEGNDLIWGGSGDDLLVGGAGNDLIWGGEGSDVLLGGGGNDMLWGDGGCNLLIGGDGRDMLFGGLLGDILIGGRTVFSDPPPAGTANRQALRAEEWKSPRTAPVRQANLGDGSGSAERLNDNYFLQLGSTVFDDGQWDPVLLGGNNRHWRLPS
jgi:Ca2+-binding RTX toxin-like protein